MTRETVIELMTKYRQNSSMAEYTAAQIGVLERELRIAQNEMILDTQALTAQLTGMPHGSGTTDQTANIACKLADGWQTERVKQIRQQIERAKLKLDMYRSRTMFVDAWLKCLTERQRVVIEVRTIQGGFARDTIIKMSQTFHEHYSKSGIRRIELAAIAKICRVAGVQQGDCVDGEEDGD